MRRYESERPTRMRIERLLYTDNVIRAQVRVFFSFRL